MTMRLWTPLASLAAFAAATFSIPATADLAVGARAPAFAAQGALAGKDFTFDLKKALKKGPVVLYFYPKAFTKGCTLEAHAFAEATPDFAKAGATVIGMSADDVPTLKRFSTEACRDKFAVAAATPEVIKAYQVALKSPDGKAMPFTSRTSYVIGRDGKVAMVHSNMDWKYHVRLTLEAVQKLQLKRRG